MAEPMTQSGGPIFRRNRWNIFLLCLFPLLAVDCGSENGTTSPPEDPNWHVLPAMNNFVTALVVYDGDLIAGGPFTQAGSVSAKGLARWDGASWSPLGEGLRGGPSNLGFVFDMIAYDGKLVVAGRFTQAGDVAANNIAQWDGASWSALGSGIEASSWQDGPFCMAVFEGRLYVGGSFQEAGGVSVRHIARWNGASWAAVGEGVGGTLSSGLGSMVLYDGDLIIAGNFATIDGTTANHVARFHVGSWGPLGLGIGGDPDSAVVTGQTVLGNRLYVGGVFPSAGGGAASNVACWDGQSWGSLGSGLNDRVEVLCRYGSDLIAGGMFTRADGKETQHVARWDGTSWWALGGGVAGGLGGLTGIYAMCVYDGSLIVGGNFTTAGGKAAGHIARWED